MIASDEHGVSISGKYDLVALHRGLLEARFCAVANDPDVSGSPILSELHRRLVQTLRAIEIEEKGTDSVWATWLKMDSTRREWSVALGRASTCSIWGKLSPEDMLRFVDDLLAPFLVDDAVRKEFVSEVERRRNA